MSNQNQTVLKQQEKTEYLVVSAKTQKPTVNDRLAELGPAIVVGAGEVPAPDWNALQEWGIAALESSAARCARKIARKKVEAEPETAPAEPESAPDAQEGGETA